MEKLLGLSLMAWLLLISGCAITHEYGPYMGKVVEKETGAPIEGAVVFMQFYTGVGNIGGMTSHYADAVETLTDVKGDFLIPLHRVNTFRILHGWVKEGYTIIFKPGYGAFPRHRETTLTHPNGTLPANERIIIELPKLKNLEERKGNLRNIPALSAPPEKYKTLSAFETFETDFVYKEKLK